MATKSIQSVVPVIEATMPSTEIPEKDMNRGMSRQETAVSSQESALQRRLEALDRANVTDERLAKVLDEGLSAEKDSEEVTADGKVITTKVPDMVVREKYLDKGMRARNWEVVNLKVEGGVDVNYRVTLSESDRLHLMAVARMLSDMNRVLEMGGADGTVQDGEIV